mgnify:CR=1 FL=1
MNRFLLSIFLLFSSLIFGIFVVLPRFQEFSSVQKEFKTKKAELESRESYFAHLKTLKERLNQEQLVAKIDAAIPNAPQLPELHEFFQQLSAGSGLVMRSIAASQDTGAVSSRLRRIDTALQLGGSYEGFKLFLADLMSASRMTDVKSVNFSSPKAGTGFVFHIRADSYSY